MAATGVRPRNLRGLMVTSVLLCVAGMMVSAYAYHVELSVQSDPTYRALCDINEGMSCTKVFHSRYGKGFGLLDRIVDKDSVINQPNSVVGMIFFLLQTCLAFNTSPGVVTFQLVTSLIAVLGCVYLACILYFVLEDFCVVCVSSYVVSGCLAVCTALKYHAVKQMNEKKSEKKKR